jgi:D-glycerate 3-kinase
LQPGIASLIEELIRQQQLPDNYSRSATKHFLPMVTRLLQERAERDIRIVGVNGAQGSGKSTLARLMKGALEQAAGLNVAVLSIDDVYLTRAEREALASRVHPLLQTRGVPGTHDIGLLSACLEELRALPGGAATKIPRFDKSNDDRLPEEYWQKVPGEVDLVILEGWCVGSTPQQARELVEPVNKLEETQDQSGIWRTYVNEQLQGAYANVFAKIDYLVFLQVPDFDSVYRWRLEQEEKLRSGENIGDSVMDEDEIAAFIQHYERLTRHNLASMPSQADVVLELGRDHQCQSSYYL